VAGGAAFANHVGTYGGTEYRGIGVSEYRNSLGG